jgi:hypothetical protein
MFVGDPFLISSNTSSRKLLPSDPVDPVDPGRDLVFHSIGESCAASGDGRGVISDSAFSIGELILDPLGDIECILAADSVERRLPARCIGIEFDSLLLLPCSPVLSLPL